jgi:hypothetical protein
LSSFWQGESRKDGKGLGEIFRNVVNLFSSSFDPIL